MALAGCKCRVASGPATHAQSTILANGFCPVFLLFKYEPLTIQPALAPSDICEALAAVIVPSGLKAGFNASIFSLLGSVLMASSEVRVLPSYCNEIDSSLSRPGAALAAR